MNLHCAWVACAALSFGMVNAAPLGEPAGVNGAVIQETGEITVDGQTLTVVRYTWTDSYGRPRSVALRPSPATPGYAIRFTHQIDQGGGNWRTANVDTPLNVGDGAFGYFVSHELFRNFTNGGQGTIASLNGYDDSPLGNNAGANGIAINGTASNTALGLPTRWVHEFRILYPRWGTKVAHADPDAAISPDPATHQLYMLPVVIRWSFTVGRDFPLWSAEVDLGGLTDKVSMDVRGPYGVVDFNENTGPEVTALRWGDRYKFAADAGASDFGATALPANNLAWTWNAQNTGRRYNTLGSGAYEFGLVDTVAASQSKYGESYASRRGATSAGGSCPDNFEMKSLPCSWEWPFQSFQYDYGPPTRPKLAWGSSFYLGTSLSSVYINDTQTVPLQGTGRIAYNLRIVYGRPGTGTPLAVGESGVAVGGPHNLEVRVAPRNGGTASYQVTGDATTYSDRNRTLPAWSSVKAGATPAGGYQFLGFDTDCAKFGAAGCASTRPCAGSTPECRFGMDAPLRTVALFGLPGATLHPRPAYMDFAPQPARVMSGVQVLTIHTEVGTPQGPIAITSNDPQFTVSDDPGGPRCALGLAATSAANNFCRAIVAFTPRGLPRAVLASLSVSSPGSAAVAVDLEGTVTAGYPLLDVNLDRKSDMLWWNASTGQVWRLFMNGLSTSGGAMAFSEPDIQWQLIHQADFNADGVTDLLYRHADGRLAQVYFNASGVAFASPVIYREPSVSWSVAAATDIDGDGRADLVWHNVATGQVYVMLMNGDAIKAQGMAYTEPDTNWRIDASGDFAGSGKRNQLVWRHRVDGRVYLMTVDYTGAGFAVSGQVIYQEPSASWAILAAADFNGDGKSDLLWRNLADGDGRVFVMLMNGATIASQGIVYREPSRSWHLVAQGDYDGDGKADLLWVNSVTGDSFGVLMDGLAVKGQGLVYRASSTAWKLVGPSMHEDF